jgi:hypothetical protein
VVAYYAAPQVPEDARRLFEAGCASIGVDRELALPLMASRAFGSSLVLAREWELADLEARLVDGIEKSFEPTWDRSSGEFTWGYGLSETHPRGQYNAFMAAAEAAGPGMWTRLSAAPLEPCPQVVGIDFPNIALSRAEWIDGNLYLRLEALVESPRRRTSFRIVGAEPRQWDISGMEGVTAELSMTGLNVTVPAVSGELQFTQGSY